jgi:hypothetical protein
MKGFSCMRKLLAIFILFFIPISAPITALADWSTPVRISEPGACSNPQILAIGDTLHVVYDNGRGRDKIGYVKSSNGGESWSEHKVISDTSGNIESFLPCILRYQGRLMVLCYSGGLNGVYNNNIAYIISSNNGISWTTPEYILNQNWERPIPFTASAIDSLVIIVAKVNFIDSTQFYELRSFNFGESWTDPRPIFNAQYGGFIDGIASGSTFHFTWNGRLNLDSILEIYYIRSTDYGQNWLENIAISEQDRYHSQVPAIALDEVGDPAIAWMDFKYAPSGFTGDIFLRQSPDSGISWSPIIELVYNHKAFQSDVAIEGDTIHVIWEDETPNMFYPRIQYARSTDYGTSWSEPFQLDQTDDESRYPTLAISNGRVYAVWSDTKYSPDTSGLFFTRWQAEPDAAHQDDDHTLPERISISAYPNPFNASVNIDYSTMKGGEIRIINSLGQIVRDFRLNASNHGRLVWDGKDEAGDPVVSGIYFVKIKSGEQTKSLKLICVK